MKIDEKGNAADSFAHIFINELQSPLYAQSSTLSSVLSSIKDNINPNDFDLIELSLNSCNYTKNLIENYWFCQKTEKEPYKPDYDTFDLIEIFNGIKRGFEVLSKYYELDFKLNSKDRLLIRADKFYFSLAIENLLFFVVNNAGKNTSINIELREKRGKFQFFIKMKNSNIYFQDCSEFFEYYDYERVCALFENSSSKSGIKISSCLMVSMAKEIIHAHFGRFFFQNLIDNVNVLGFEMPV